MKTICVFVQAIKDRKEEQVFGHQRQKLIIKILQASNLVDNIDGEKWWIEEKNILRSCNGMINLIPGAIIMDMTDFSFQENMNFSNINFTPRSDKTKILLRDH